MHATDGTARGAASWIAPGLRPEGSSPAKSTDARAVESGVGELAHAQLKAAGVSGDFTDGPRAGADGAQSAPSHAKARRRLERRQVGGFLLRSRAASPVRLGDRRAPQREAELAVVCGRKRWSCNEGDERAEKFFRGGLT